MKFKESIENAIKSMKEDGSPVSQEWELCVHHYIASQSARDQITRRWEEAAPEVQKNPWATHVQYSFGMTLPNSIKLDEAIKPEDPFIPLTKKYYDSVIQTRHTAVGGVEHLGLGYGGCGLPVILDHNTPNNSIALLWAETQGGNDGNAQVKPMRPLFRRRQRHS